MKQVLFHNLGWKLLSLLIAVALWIAVAREPELDTSLSVPVEFKNMPDDLDFNSGVPDSVRLEVRGQSGRLSRDNLADVAVVFDLSTARAGDHTYTIRDGDINLPSGVSLDRATPSQLTLSFERFISRDVPVKPLYHHLPPGYRVQDADIDPSKVRIRGPEQRVRSMEWVPTDPIDLNGVVGDKEIRTQVNVGDPQVRTEFPVTIKVKVKVALENRTPKAEQ